MCVFLVISGCAANGKRLFTSRWAMDDQKYAAQYSAPYSENKAKKWSRMGQQIVDARFQEGKTALYADAGLATKHRTALGGEVGVTHLPYSWATARIGLVGLVAEGLPSYLVGGTLGVRVHAPTRLSPYVGLAGMAGYSQASMTADHSYADSNGHWISKGETIPGDSAGMAAIIPEAGLSWWANAATRTSLGAKYYFTTDGRSEDFLLIGMTLEYVGWGSGGQTFPPEPPQTASPELDEVLESEAYFKTEKENEIHEFGLRRYEIRPPSSESLSEQAIPLPDLLSPATDQTP